MIMLLLGLYVISRIASFRRKTTHNVQCSQEDKTSEERSNLIGRRWKKKIFAKFCAKKNSSMKWKSVSLKRNLSILMRAKRASFLTHWCKNRVLFINSMFTTLNQNDFFDQKFIWQLWILAPKFAWIVEKSLRKRHLSINNYNVQPKSVLDAVLLHYQ